MSSLDLSGCERAGSRGAFAYNCQLISVVVERAYIQERDHESAVLAYVCEYVQSLR